MKKSLILFLIFIPIHASANKWVPVKFGDLYSLSKSNTTIVGVTSHNLGNRKQATITHLQSTKNQTLFKCVEYYSENLEPTLGECYALEK